MHAARITRFALVLAAIGSRCRRAASLPVEMPNGAAGKSILNVM
jgi:hypothetical protein